MTKFFRRKRIILMSLILLMVFFSAVFVYYAHSPIDKKNITIIVNIPTGVSFLETTEILSRAGLVKSRLMFYGLAVIKDAQRRIRAGEYEINTLQTPSQMIDKLIRGDVKYYKVVIPEDLTMREIADRLYEYKLINKEIFFNLARDKEFLQSLNIQADSIEGYLFPDTYFLVRSMSTKRIMKEMVDTFWKKVTPQMIKRAAEMKWSIHQLVTFASLIGKESGNDAEKPFISAVFHNRLKRGMPLQSDPTSVYDLDNFKGKIVRSHLKRKSRYNTYFIKGLPPGPIANPGLTSICAALYPADVGYLYFVAKNDGSHFFSNTFSEHIEAVNRYIYMKEQQIQDVKDGQSISDFHQNTRVQNN